MAPMSTAEVLSHVPECEKAAMCLREKTCVLDGLPSGLSASAVGQEFYIMVQQCALNKVF